MAFFARPGTSNGPTEAINGRVEHLRGSALGFRNLINYTARALDARGRVTPVAVRQEDVAGASGLRGMIKGASSPR